MDIYIYTIIQRKSQRGKKTPYQEKTKILELEEKK